MLMCGRMIFSKVFAMGERAIGLYEERREGFLLGLVMGMILEVFHIWGMVFVLILMLKRLVKCLMAMGPKCLRLIFCGLEELLFWDFFIAWMISVSVIIIGVDVSDLGSLFIETWVVRSVEETILRRAEKRML